MEPLPVSFTTRTDMTTDKIKRALRKKSPKGKAPVPTKTLLSTGSTLIDLACTGRWQGGFAKGLYFWLVGDSTSGKTWLSMTCLAEAAVNPEFDGYRFIYDNGEDGALMDIAKFFGQAVADRLEPPSVDSEGLPVYSGTIEEFWYHLDDALKAGPCIYIIDSMDSLTTEQEEKKFDEAKAAHRKGRESAGDYGMSKAKLNSTRLRKILKPLKQTGSILIIISQTRDNVGAMGYGDKKTAAGGRSLKFYACIEIWSSVKGRIKKTVKGMARQVGIVCRIRTKKNRINGKERTVDVPIYWSYGIDNTGSCVEWLIKEKHWKKVKGQVTATEFDFTGSVESLIKHIEENELERDLKEIVSEVWNDIEDALVLQRKPRY